MWYQRFRKSISLFLFICSSLLCFAQCKSSPEELFKSKGGLRVWLSLDESSVQANDGSVDVRSQTIQTLMNRITYYGVTPHIEWVEPDNYILLEIPGVQEPEPVLGLIESNANLEFWEVFNLTEIYPQLVNADTALGAFMSLTKEDFIAMKQSDERPRDALEALLEAVEDNPDDEHALWEQAFVVNHPLFARLNLNIYDSQLIDGPVIGYVKAEDKDLLMEYLHMDVVKSVLPSFLVFKYGAKPIDEGGNLYELYALKMTTREGRGAALDGSVVTEAKATRSYDENIISLRKNEAGTRMWALITRENIGKHIAIVVGDQVYSAPRVQCEITGGQSSLVTGGFTKEETTDLANLLNAGHMPVPITIVRHELVPPAAK